MFFLFIKHSLTFALATFASLALRYQGNAIATMLRGHRFYIKCKLIVYKYCVAFIVLSYIYYLIFIPIMFITKRKMPRGKYDLRRQDFSIKGKIGEIIIQGKIPHCHRTRETSCKRFLNYQFPFGKIPLKYKIFLEINWNSIDLLRIISKDMRFCYIELIEVKTRNYYPNLKKQCYIPDMTTNQFNVYKAAQKLGFVVKSATIWFYDDWRYDLIFDDFNPQNFKVHDGSKRYIEKNIEKYRK